MSAIQQVQLTSVPCHMTPLFTAFQTLNNTTTLEAFSGTMAVPVAVTSPAASHNPVGLIDNRIKRLTTLMLAFGLTTANAKQLAFDVMGFTQIGVSGLYLRTRFFLGEAMAGNIDISSPISETTAFLADNFNLKTYASFNVQYIEPNDDVGAALLVCDIRGMDFVTVRLAQGASAPATKAQVWYGWN